MKLIGQEKTYPAPTGQWVLVRKDKKSLTTGLVLPEHADGAYEFFIMSVGPDVDSDVYIQGKRVELQPKRALATGVMLDDLHALILADAIVGIYP